MALQINKRMIFLIVIVLVLGLWTAGSIILGLEYFNLKKKVDNNDSKAVVQRLEKHMKVPQEEPTVATITDAIKLKEQEPFYKNAQNGDKVVIWKDKALIYRMDEDKIIDFGVVIRSQNQASPSPGAPQSSATPSQ
jgi:predicted membrane protein